MKRGKNSYAMNIMSKLYNKCMIQWVKNIISEQSNELTRQDNDE